MKPSQALLICLLLAGSSGALWDSVAVRKVREGIRLFKAGEYSKAGNAFEAADADQPNNDTITFDQACTLTAQGKSDEAKDLFQQAALARETGLSADAYYNLGHLAGMNARQMLGDDPVNLNPENRNEVIASLLSAVGHYRDCLRMESSHAEARHNLELIRLYIKNIQSQWEQRDRETARNELSLLDFLAMIEQQQQGLRKITRMLSQEDDSPRKRQAIKEATDSQRRLQEETEPLKQKLTAELQKQLGQQPPQDNEHQQVLTILNQMADDAGNSMLKAADQLQIAELETSEQTQKDTLDQLNEIYMVVAPFTKVLEQATNVQEQLVAESNNVTESSGSPHDHPPMELQDVDGDSASDVASSESRQIDDDRAAEFSWQQSRISDWGRLLSLKAEVELPQVEAQIEEMETQKPHQPNASPDDGQQQPSADPSDQLKALVESLRKAIDLGPQVEQHSVTAEEHLSSAAVDQALPEQQEALRLLKEIAQPIADQNSKDQQQGDQNQNENHDQQQDSPDKDQSQQNQQNERHEQQRKLSRQQAESVLRRAREREREHRDRKKELRKILGGIIAVDRDW
ncbi:MAG: hypothetical protein MK102_04070 [Fuerstiella sp.]|nr:hypothetical protein [Fuerstiella sp.]